MNIVSTLTTVLCTYYMLTVPVLADSSISIGGDLFISGDDPSVPSTTTRDLFISGFSVTIDQDIGESAHATGFSVDVDGSIGDSLYVAGASVEVRAKVKEDATLTGFTIELHENARIGGNARLAGGTVTIDAPIDGSLVVGAGSLTLNSIVEGDAMFEAQSMSFGDDARILGKLRYSAPQSLDIPTSVIDSGNVTYTPVSDDALFDDVINEMHRGYPSMWPSIATRMTGFFVSMLFLLSVAAIMMSFFPQQVEKLRIQTREYGWRSLVYGFLGLSMLFGAIPVGMISIVGLPLIPFILLAILATWTLSYLLGVYVLTDSVSTSLTSSTSTTPARLLVLAIGLIGLSLLNFIPLIGWLVNVGILLSGLGTLTLAAMRKLVGFNK